MTHQHANYKQLREKYYEERNRRESGAIVAITILIASIALLVAFLWPIRAHAEVTIDMAKIAVIESSGVADAYNKSSGAIGLCQVTPVVLVEFDRAFHTKHNKVELYSASFNITVADWYMNTKLPKYLKYYGIADNIKNRLWAYNAGIGMLVRGVMPKETKQYIAKYARL